MPRPCGQRFTGISQPTARLLSDAAARVAGMTDQAAASAGIAGHHSATRTGRPSVALRALARVNWTSASLAGLLTATAVLYLWDLGASGWANSFYSAAVLAGSRS